MTATCLLEINAFNLEQYGGMMCGGMMRLFVRSRAIMPHSVEKTKTPAHGPGENCTEGRRTNRVT